MEFCVCDNMLSLKMGKENSENPEDKDKLFYTCRACKKDFPAGENFDPCVYKKNHGGDHVVFYESFVNKYTFDDPTLPFSTEFSCPRCSKEGKKTEVIYIRYDEDNMNYIYLCKSCRLAWIHPEYQKVTELFTL